MKLDVRRTSRALNVRAHSLLNEFSALLKFSIREAIGRQVDAKAGFHAVEIDLHIRCVNSDLGHESFAMT